MRDRRIIDRRHVVGQCTVVDDYPFVDRCLSLTQSTMFTDFIWKLSERCGFISSRACIVTISAPAVLGKGIGMYNLIQNKAGNIQSLVSVGCDVQIWSLITNSVTLHREPDAPTLAQRVFKSHEYTPEYIKNIYGVYMVRASLDWVICACSIYREPQPQELKAPQDKMTK